MDYSTILILLIVLIDITINVASYGPYRKKFGVNRRRDRTRSSSRMGSSSRDRGSRSRGGRIGGGRINGGRNRERRKESGSYAKPNIIFIMADDLGMFH